MSVGFLTVKKAGVLSLIQDKGRHGCFHNGITQSGAMDSWSAHWANKLCANPVFAALIEVSMGGLELTASEPTIVAVTGADDVLKVNGKPVASWRSVSINAGDRLSIGFSPSAMRVYLAVRGGFQIAPTFASVATNTREAIGGLSGHGEALKVDDKLAYFPSKAASSVMLPARWRNWWQEDVELLSEQHFRIMPSNQYADFPASIRKQLFSHAFCVSQDMSRMAYRLTGELPHALPGMLSEATALGDVQIPPNGQPIVLLNDRQTLGGYPKIGTLAHVDCWRLSQLKPKDTLYFQLTSSVRARNRYIELHKWMQEINLCAC